MSGERPAHRPGHRRPPLLATTPDRPLVLGGVDHRGGARAWPATATPTPWPTPWPTPCSAPPGLGDLGRHFPDTDPVWEGADSVAPLTEVVAGRGGRAGSPGQRRLHGRGRAAPPGAAHRRHGGAPGRGARRARCREGDPGRGPGRAGPGRGHRLPGRGADGDRAGPMSPPPPGRRAAVSAPGAAASGRRARAGAMRGQGGWIERRRRRAGTGRWRRRRRTGRSAAGGSDRARTAGRRRAGAAGPGELGGDQVEGRRAVLELLTAGRRTGAPSCWPRTRTLRRSWTASRSWPRACRVQVETCPRARLDSPARTEAPQGVLALARPLEPVALEDLCRPDRAAAAAVPAGGRRDHRPAQPGRAPAQRRVRRRHRRRAAPPPLGPAVAHGDQDGGRRHRAPALRRGGRRARRPQRARRARCVAIGLAGEARTVALRPAARRRAGRAGGGQRGEGAGATDRRRCDGWSAIPQHGTLPSLNVGVAGAVACFEVARQRAGAEPTSRGQTSSTVTPFQKATRSVISLAVSFGSG